jgi:hypothetical protein
MMEGDLPPWACAEDLLGADRLLAPAGTEA